VKMLGEDEVEPSFISQAIIECLSDESISQNRVVRAREVLETHAYAVEKTIRYLVAADSQ